ncbi:hypothetical protein [Phocaeicola plebeius]|jgi:hypothetical protein|uniref:hypothetical protein n=1 Tax=Phocaeicola plebeius TaxID=310297 RepID=UPI0026EEEF13|nr:hypothetical protein [Phocaeicola plebeius]
MEWIGLILEILLLGIFLIWEGYNKKKGENFAMKEDSREINYESEKGKNLATKEDIAQITKEIESIKGNYNKSLELYKFELSRFFESSKIIIDLCNSLDNKLIHLIIECKENIDNDFLRNNRDYSNTLKSVYKLGRFFLVYRSRYESNKNIDKIIEITSLLSCLIDGGKLSAIDNNKLEKKIEELEQYFQKLLSEILPPFKPEKVEKPEA